MREADKSCTTFTIFLARGAYLASSWWQKITWSRIACETPKRRGICRSNSPHLCDKATRFPLPSVVRKTPSSCLNVKDAFFCVTSIERTTTMDEPARLVNRNLILPLTLLRPTLFGSWTNDCPLLMPGGKFPVTANLRVSMIVVFPQPLAPINKLIVMIEKIITRNACSLGSRYH